MDELTIHGLPRVFSQKKKHTKVFWAILFSCCCGFLFYTLHKSLSNFRKYPVTVKVERKTFSKQPFPTLTICDTDRVSYPSLKEEKFPTNCFGDIENKSAVFKHGCELFLAGFQGNCIFDSAKYCSFPVDFTPAPHWQFCYTINKNGSLYQSMPDRSLSFHLVMFKNESALLPPTEEGFNLLRSTQTRRGLVVHIHSPIYETGAAAEKIVSLIPGFFTDISLRKMNFHRLKAPFHSNCSSVGTTKNHFGGNYSVKNCLASCFLNEMYNRCGDVSPEWNIFLSEDEYPRKPKMNDMRQCYRMTYEALREINCDCPDACYEETYDIKVQYNPLRMTSISPEMNRRLAKALNVPEDQINLRTYKENVARLNLFYDTFTVEEIVEQPLYQIEDLLSGFGGLMGLLTGASVISIIELFLLFTDFLVKKICKRLKIESEN